MYYYIYADKDATIYSEVSKDHYKMNTGMDEILELHKKVPPVNDKIENSRILLKFDISSVSSSIASSVIPTTANFDLRLFTARPSELPLSYSIESYPISGSWSMGLGKKYYSPILKDGVSWKYKTSETSDDGWITSSFNTDTTGSVGSMSVGGGNWFTASGGVSLQSTQNFEYESADVKMNVTDIVQKWMTGSIANEGFIIKRTDTDEQSSANQGILTFFSRDTHTIYPPRIEVKWDDSKWVTTGSIGTASLDSQPIVYMKGRGRTFKELSKVKFRVYTRDRYKTISPTVGKYEMFKHYYLPSGSSYYSIKDTVTEETIIPFSDESRLSADTTSNYFNIWMNGLQPERYYRVLIKAVSGSGTSDEQVQFYDDNFTFKVVR